jgi:hypothetical protein
LVILFSLGSNISLSRFVEKCTHDLSKKENNETMTRYKGRVSAKTIERDFPHVVETVVPEGGLGKTLEAMHEFHKRHRIEACTGKGRRDKNGRDYIRWCFANPGIAAKFASQFVRG